MITNREAHLKSGSLFTINAGFFDPKNQKTVSYIINDYQTVEDPIFNSDLMLNPVLRKNLKKILGILLATTGTTTLLLIIVLILII